MRTDNRGELIRVDIGALELGMYVAELDRPWLGTPFLLQGFHVKSQSDVDALAEHCRYVLVDPRRYERTLAITHSGRSKASASLSPIDYKGKAKEGWDTSSRDDERSMRDEYIDVKPQLEDITHSIAETFSRIRAGRRLNLQEMGRIVDPIIASVLRNKHALAALIRIKKKDDYTYSHSISTAVWAVIVGRHLNLDRAALRTLAMGCALIDVGKVALPRELLEKPGQLEDDETALVRRHVEESVRILTVADGVDARIIEIVAAHHERHDGSGYPHGIAGTSIPLGARIAGLADSYDAMITPRPYAEARSSYQAMQELARQKDVRFQGALVEQLMQSIGLFPTGSLVELNTGEVAIVVAQNPSRRLKPKVIVVLNAQKQRMAELPVVDLLALEQSEGPAATRIARELAPGAHGIDPEDYYL